MRVLLVDDNPNDRELVKRRLRKAIGDVQFVEVVKREDFKAALQRGDFDIVLTDYRLHWSDGFAVLQAVKLQYPHIPVVMVTDSGNEEVAARGMREGLSDYVLKGHLTRLPDAVREAIERERLNREYARALEELRRSHEALQEAMRQLQETQQQVIQQQRLRALGEMASGIAHDFNNALTPILGLTELLLETPTVTADPQVKRYLEMIHTAAQDAAQTVSRLREFYRPRGRAELRQPLDVNAIVEEAVQLTAPRWKEQAEARGVFIRVHTHLQPLPQVFANGGELREVLQNLIFNAVDALPNGGDITIRTYLSQSAQPEYVVIEVQDNGIGMDAETRVRCFEPFFSTKGEQGSGLGLAVVYGIVQRHEGKIEVDSQLGAGTTFRVFLPLSVEEEAVSASEQDISPNAPLRILLVEDKPLVREVLREHLLRQGHLVETAADGKKGLEKFLQSRFDLVITDLAMPVMSGEQLAAEIKRVAPNKPIILLTGFGDSLHAQNAYADLVDHVLIKPVTHYALRQAIAKVTAE
ncbi:MAG: response regulator [Armatimonadota bacterium]|nr:response regulator [bacterium]MDW8104283.1 response regulator [Armatimonadota bacterium]MDW8290375.1 response regulator [Armatimonadota bacterium]